MGEFKFNKDTVEKVKARRKKFTFNEDTVKNVEIRRARKENAANQPSLSDFFFSQPGNKIPTETETKLRDEAIAKAKAPLKNVSAKEFFSSQANTQLPSNIEDVLHKEALKKVAEQLDSANEQHRETIPDVAPSLPSLSLPKNTLEDVTGALLSKKNNEQTKINTQSPKQFDSEFEKEAIRLQTEYEKNRNEPNAADKFANDINAAIRKERDKVAPYGSETSPSRVSQAGYELADALNRYALSEKYGLTSDIDPVRYDQYRKNGEYLASKAQNAADFETRNVYGKKQSQGIDAVKAYLLRNFPDLNMRNFITDPEHEWLGGQEGESVFDRGHDFFDAMTEEQKKILGYYIATDEEKAERYVEAITLDVGSIMAEKYAASADDWYDKLLYNIFSVGTENFNTGMQGAFRQLLGETGYQPPTPIQQGGAEIRYRMEQNGEDFLLGISDAGAAIVQMIPSFVVGAFSRTAGAALMGVSASGNAYNEAINKGLSRSQASTYATLVGASETLLEKALGSVGRFGGKSGTITTKILKKIDAAYSNVARNLPWDISEFGEEFIQSYIEPWFMSVVTNEEYEAPDLEEALYNGLIGAIVGGIAKLGGRAVPLAVRGINKASQSIEEAKMHSDVGEKLLKTENANEDIKKLIDNAQQSGDKKLQKAANKVAKTEKDGTYDVSARKVGRLAQMSKEQLVQSLMDTATGKDLKSQTVEKLTKSGMNQKGAERAFDLIVHDASRGSESKELQSLINKNPDIRTMYDNMVEYLSEKAVTKRVEDVAKASPVTEITNRITEQRLKDAGIEVVDESGDIDNIDSVVNVDEYGNYILKRESGATYTYDPKTDKLPNVDGKNAKKVTYAANFSANGANTYVKLAPDNATSQYKADFTRIYNQGATGKAFSQIETDISPEAQEKIYEAGKADRDAAIERRSNAETKAKEKEASFVKKEMGFKSDRVTLSKEAAAKIKSVSDKGISDQYKAAVKVIDGLAKMLQVNINIVASETDANGNYIGARGMYNRATNTFTFDIMSGMDNVADISYSAMIKTAGHELTHFIQNWSPSKYLTLKNTTLKFLKDQNDAAWITKRLDEIQSDNEAIGKNLTLEQAKDELVADAFEDVLSNIDFAETILRTDKTLFDKIHSWVKKNVNDFKKNLGIAVKDVEANSDAAKEMRKAGEQAQALYNQWADAFSTALENSTSGQTDVDSGVQLQARRSKDAEAFAKDVTEWDKKGQQDNVSFILGSTGDVLQGLGAIESDIYMLGDKIKQILDEHPEMTLEEIKKIPLILENPILILHSRGIKRGNRQNTRLVIFGMVKAQDGRHILSTLDLRPQEGNLVIDDMQKVTSAYTKDTNPTNFIERSKVLYADKNKTAKLLRTIGFYMPIELQQSGYIGSISYKRQNVNINGKPFSEVFSVGIDPDTQAQVRRRNKNYLDVESRFGVAESVLKYAETVSDPALKAKLKANATTYAKKLDEYETESIRYDNATANRWDEMAATAYYAMTMAKTVINQIETDADFALSLETAVGAFENYSEETRKQYQEKYKKAIAESKDKVAYIRNEMRAMQRDISDSERKAKEFAQREKKANYRAKQIELRNQRDRYMSFLSKEKTRIKTALEKPSETASVPKDTQELAKKLIGVIDSFNKFNNSSALTKSSAELIEKIVSIANAEMEAGRSKSLVQKTNATDKVLLGLKLSFDQVRSSLDALVAEYEKLSPKYERKDGEKAPSAAAAIVYDEQLHNALNALAKDFSAPELVFEHGLSYVYEGIKVIRAMNHQLLKANQMYVKGKSVEVLKLRNMLLQDVKMASPFLNKFLGNALVSNVLMPKTMLHIVFGATENADIFYDMLDDGQMRYIRFMNGAREIFSPVAKEIENEKFKSDKPTLKTGLKYMDGTDVLLNYEFALSFIKIVENEDSLRHAVWGGLQIPDLVPYNKGDKSAYNSKRLVEHAQPEYAPDAMTDEQIAKTLEKASEEGRTITDQEYLDMYAQQIVWNNRQNLAKEIEAKYKAAALMLKDQMSKTETGKKALTMLSLMTRYYDQYARKYLNEATMELYGFEKTLQEGKTYYPIRVRKDEKATDDNVDIIRDFSLENWGSMKHRVDSKKGIELYGALTELESYMENTAKFYAWTTVTKNMKKILNTQIIDDNGTVTTLVGKVNQLYGSYDPEAKGVKKVKNKFMSGFEKYMKDLQTEIIGANKGGEKWAKLQGAFVTNALLMNISTPLVQYSATPLVAVDSGYLSFIKTVAKGGKIPALLSEAQKQYVAKYSEVYRYRSSGLINVDLAAAKQNKGVVSKALSSKALAWTESADAQVLGKQFYALLDHVKRTHKGISAEEAARIAGKQLDQTIYEFQANYTVLQRAPVLRGSGIKKLMFGTFRTQQLTMLNAMIDSSVRSHTLSEQMKQVKKDSPEYKALERKRSDSKKRTAKIHLAIALSNALNAFIRMGVGFIRRKDDEEKGETAFIDFLDSYLSMIPLFGDIASAIVSIASGRMFYGEKVFSLGMLDTLSDSITSAVEFVGMLFDGEDQKLSKYIKELTDALAVAGVPARNIYNIIKMIMGWAEDAADAAGWDWDLDVDEW